MNILKSSQAPEKSSAMTNGPAALRLAILGLWSPSRHQAAGAEKKHVRLEGFIL